MNKFKIGDAIVYSYRPWGSSEKTMERGTVVDMPSYDIYEIKLDKRPHAKVYVSEWDLISEFDACQILRDKIRMLKG